MLPTILLITAACFLGQADVPDRPPPLTFDKPVDYVAWYNDFVRRGRDEKDNAYPLYLKLCPDENGEGGFPKPEGKAAEQFEQAVGRVWTVEEFPELAAYLKECEPYFANFERATKRRALFDRPDPNIVSVIEVSLPICDVGHQIIKAWNCRLWMKKHRSANEIRRFIGSALAFASHIEQYSLLLGNLVALACRDLVYQQLLSFLDDGLLNEKQCVALLNLCQKLDRGDYSWERALAFEWAACLDGIQMFALKEEADPNRWRQIQPVLQMLELDKIVSKRGEFDFEAAKNFADEHFSEIIRLSKQKKTIRKAVEAIRKYEEESSAAIRENVVLQVLIGKYQKAFELSLETSAMRRGSLATLALHIYHIRESHWPDSINQIAKLEDIGRLRAIATDPYSNKPFVYKLLDAQPLLYSVGVNGKDDGGVHHPKFGEGADGPADYVFWPRPKDEKK